MWDVIDKTGRRFIAFAVGIVLLVASLLKAIDMLVGASPTGWAMSPWSASALMQAEIALGYWLISGLYRMWSWRVALAAFSMFALASLWAALAGESSCGCFGSWSPHPAWTALLDVLIVAALIRWRPVSGASEAPPIRSLASRAGIATLGAYVATSVGLAALSALTQGSPLDGVGRVLNDGKTIVIVPENWEGERLPLLDWIETEDSLAEGRWRIILHRPGCDECERYIRDAIEHRDDSQRLALVSLESTPTTVSRWDVQGNGRLAGEYEWYADTPLAIDLSDGLVVAVE